MRTRQNTGKIQNAARDSNSIPAIVRKTLKIFLEDIRTGVKSQRAAEAHYQISRSIIKNKN
jgi:hypothetical protein